MKIIGFGDSWAYGAELQKDEYPFIHWLSEHYGCEYINNGREGASMGTITKDVLDNIHLIDTNDIVTVVIPPDIRWYTENDKKWRDLTKDCSEWKALIKDGKSIEWFVYHHNLFIFAIISALQLCQCRFVLMHNYGNLQIKYKSIIDVQGHFLSTDNLTSLLNGGNDFFWNYDPDFLNDGAHSNFKGKYFEGCEHHPNELGHKKISNLIINYFNI